ncbi:MAG: hypothetical protein QXX95_06505 [Nitrososphaerales archaeon]
MGERPEPLELTLGDGRIIKAKFYLVDLELEGRIWPVRVASFEGAVPVVGVATLEGHGFTLDLDKKKLTPSRGNYALYV